MPRYLRRVPLLLLLGLAVGCASNAGGVTPRNRSDTITVEQLRTLNQTNLYDAIAAIRPNWLRARSPNSFMNPGSIQVYFDDVRIGGVEALRSLSSQGVAYIRWYDPISASARWGLDHEQGALVIATSAE